LTVFVDSNIPMYVAGADHPHKASARRFLEQVRSGKIDACTSTEVLQEILHRYTSLGRRDLARDVYNLFAGICPVVLGVTLADTDRARDLLVAHHGISSRDAVHAAVMLNHRVKTIATFDAGFDGITGIKRVHLA
jgi:predicted nucleic acid-binding protein